jgi:hypothetical protein
MKNTKNEKPRRKLHTKTETLRLLSGSDLERVVGGVGTTATSTCNCNGSTC